MKHSTLPTASAHLACPTAPGAASQASVRMYIILYTIQVRFHPLSGSVPSHGSVSSLVRLVPSRDSAPSLARVGSIPCQVRFHPMARLLSLLRFGSIPWFGSIPMWPCPNDRAPHGPPKRHRLRKGLRRMDPKRKLRAPNAIRHWFAFGMEDCAVGKAGQRAHLAAFGRISREHRE